MTAVKEEPNLNNWLIDEPDKHKVLDRLSLLCGHKLSTYLHDAQIESFVISKGPSINGPEWTADLQVQNNDYFARSRYRLQRIAIKLHWKHGKPTLLGECSACNENFRGTTCKHRLLLVLALVRMHCTEVNKLLNDNKEIEKRTLSDSAIAVLQALNQKVQESASSTDIDSANRQKKILRYTLITEDKSVCMHLLMDVCTKYKSGGLGKPVPVRWSDLTHLLGTESHRLSTSRQWGVEQEGVEVVKAASATDKKLAKSLFLQTELSRSFLLDLSKVDMVGIFQELCNQGRLVTDRVGTPPLTWGAPRAATLRWQRNTRGTWVLGAGCGEDAIFVSSSPAFYIDWQSSSIGLAQVTVSAVAAKIMEDQTGIKDTDIEALLRLAPSDAIEINIPKLPDIKVRHGGLVRAKPKAILSWSKEGLSDYGANRLADKDYNYGIALAQLELQYPGLLTVADQPGKLMSVSGETTTYYDKDQAFEKHCRCLIGVGNSEPDHVNDVWEIAGITRNRNRVRAAMKDFHDSVVPQLHREKWSVAFAGEWPDKNIKLSVIDLEATDQSDGWYQFRMGSTIDGMQLDLLPILKAALSDKKVLASLQTTSNDSVWKLPTESGYVIAISALRLKKLLPFFLALTMDKEDRVAKLRRLDFGVLKQLSDASECKINGAEELANTASKLSNFTHKLPAHTIKALAAPARSYQEYGVSWIDARRQQGFGAIIADEYAVGKTLQSLITIFNAANEENRRGLCSLVIVTKTLLFEGRWQEEAAKFLPSLKIQTVYGTRGVSSMKSVAGVDIVLTTYDTVVAKVNAFADIQWNVVACDEAHKVNNSSVQAHKAIALLKAQQKLMITGSPMQNTPRELWSLMELVVPGLLRDKSWFDSTFPKLKVLGRNMEIQEVTEENHAANAAKLNALGKIVSPFFLRRLNTELGRELPPVQVIERHVVMEPDQADFYEIVRAAGHREVQALIAEKGLNGSKIEAMVHINRLRQVCADPAIVKINGQKTSKASSAKIVAISELVKEIVEDQKQVVITSEWNSVLANIETSLKADGVASVTMTGQLSGTKRKEAQTLFRSGHVPVLLIQLVLAQGIELPEGDAIIIVEPWWNRKKEEQAIARLRRDERSKHITVIRLVIPGSVEVGVTRVAESKLEDIEAVQQGQIAGSGGLTLEDIDAFFEPLDTKKASP